MNTKRGKDRTELKFKIQVKAGILPLFLFLFSTSHMIHRIFLTSFLGLLGLFLLPIDQSFGDAKIPFSLPNRAELRKLRSAILYTNKGEIAFKLYPEEAPWHVANLKYLSDKGFYKNLKFHIYKEGYIIQGGAPLGNPNGGPGYFIPAEFNDHKHVAGTLGMARYPDDLNPKRQSHGSQFHILLTETSKMDGAFTVFGDVVGGMDTLYELREGDTIRDFKVFVAGE